MHTPASVIVRVPSLNQAYTFASRRLEPSRRSHTGRIYDRLRWLTPRGYAVFLEEIRSSVEAGTWSDQRERHDKSEPQD